MNSFCMAIAAWKLFVIWQQNEVKFFYGLNPLKEVNILYYILKNWELGISETMQGCQLVCDEQANSVWMLFFIWQQNEMKLFMAY
jgi:hypothetical protein